MLPENIYVLQLIKPLHVVIQGILLVSELNQKILNTQKFHEYMSQPIWGARKASAFSSDPQKEHEPQEAT